MKKQLLCPVAAALLTMPSLTLAEETESLSGTISAGVFVIDSGNNLNPNSSKNRIDSLDSAADRETTFRAIALPRVTWDAGAADGLKFHLITDPPIDEAGSFTIDFGASWNMDSRGIIDGGLFFTPFEEVWKNPYLIDADREETDTYKYGGRIGINKIMGTGFRVQLVVLNDDVDDDVIGQLVPELARDGAVYSINTSYSYYISSNLELRPRLSLRRGEYDGDANSFIKYKGELEARYRYGKIMVAPRLYYSHSDYDETDPIFNKTRKNDGYGLNVMTTYMAPFDMTDWSLSGLLVLSRGDANIDFYDTESITCGVTVNYHF